MKQIEDYLQNKNIKYIKNKLLSDYTFDYYLPTYNMYIDYEVYNTNDVNYTIQNISKVNFCIKNKIKLIKIPYNMLDKTEFILNEILLGISYCMYRNCDNELSGRKNKKYCSIQCKRNEAKYRQRRNKVINS